MADASEDTIRIRPMRPGEGVLWRRFAEHSVYQEPLAMGLPDLKVTDTMVLPAATYDSILLMCAAQRHTVGTAWLAELDGAPVGMLLAWPMSRGGDPQARMAFYNVWVEPSARRRGVAAAMVNQAAEWAVMCGWDEQELWVVEQNTGARHVYEAAGFRASGKREPLRGVPGVHELEMVRGLDL